MKKPVIDDPTQELGYFAKRTGLYMAGKGAVDAVAEPVAVVLEQVVSRPVFNAIGSLGAVGGALNGVAMLLAIGFTAAVSAALSQMDYLHKKDTLTNQYKEELAAKLKKSPGGIGKPDLEAAAGENRTLAEELRRAKKQRNYGVVVSFVASMVSLAAIKIALPAALTAMGVSLGTVGLFVAAMVVGAVTYNLVKAPIHAVADKLFDIDEKTTHDYIMDIKRGREAGKTVTREQVLAVYASANPQLDTLIAADYGRKFDDLSQTEQRRAVQDLRNLIPLHALTADINSGKINATELAFAVDGQISGVNHEKSPSLQKTDPLKAMWTKVKKNLKRRASPGMDIGTEAVSQAINAMPMERENAQPDGLFVERLGLARHDPQLAHVERLDQARGEPAPTLLQPS